MAKKPQNTTGKNTKKDAPIIDADFEVLEQGQAGGENAKSVQEAQDESPENEPRFYTNPPDYDSADEYTRALIEARIERLDLTDLNTIYDFGQDSIAEMNEVSKKIADSARANGTLLDDTGKIFELADELDFGKIMEGLKDVGNKVAGTARRNWRETLGAGVGLMLSGPLGAIAGGAAAHAARRKADRDRERKHNGNNPEKVMAALESASLTVNKIERELKDSLKILSNVRDNNQRLGEARVQAHSEVCLDIAAAKEALRRLDERILPDMESNPDKYDSMQVDAYRLGRDMLDHLLTDMVGAHVVNKNSLVMLNDMTRIFANAEAKLHSHLKRSLPQWRSQIAQGSTMVAAYKISARIDEADHFGGKMHTDIDTSHQLITDMMKKSMEQGTFDIESIEQATNQLAQRLRDAVPALEHRQKLEEARERITRSSTELERAFKENSQGRIGYVADDAGRLLAGGQEEKAQNNGVKKIAGPSIAGAAKASFDKASFDEAATGQKPPANDEAGKKPAPSRTPKVKRGPSLS